MSSGLSFSDLMKQYDSQQGGDENGTLLSSTPSTSATSSGSAFFQGLGDSFSSTLKSVGQSQYLKGTALESVDLESQEESTTQSSEESTLSLGFTSLSRTERFKGFVLMMVLSAFFFSLAMFFVGVAVLFPAKFAFPFSMGSICFMSAFALVKGPSNWAKTVFSMQQLPFSLAYFGSIVGTLWACLVWRSYVFVVLFAGVQIVALGYYAFGNMPGGQYGLRMAMAFVKQFALNVCWPCAKGVVRLFRSLFS